MCENWPQILVLSKLKMPNIGYVEFDKTNIRLFIITRNFVQNSRTVLKKWTSLWHFRFSCYSRFVMRLEFHGVEYCLFLDWVSRLYRALMVIAPPNSYRTTSNLLRQKISSICSTVWLQFIIIILRRWPERDVGDVW